MERYFAVLSMLVVFLVSAALQIMFKPYAFAELHRMHLVSTSCLAATTVGALAMFAYDMQESTALQLRIAIAVLVLMVNVMFRNRKCIQPIHPPSKVVTVGSWVHVRVYAQRRPYICII
jgi:hypothetical protein